MAVAVLNCAERADLGARLDELGDPFPEFMYDGDPANRYWDDLYDRFSAVQLVLYGPDSDSILGKGNTIPIVWDGTIGGLLGGIDDVLPLAPFERFVSWRRRRLVIRPMDSASRATRGRDARSVSRIIRRHGKVAEWQEWTGLVFPGSGQYALEGVSYRSRSIASAT